MLPNFLVIGAPRAGTTWIHSNLRRHPDVFVPRKKEIHFFDRHYDRGIEFYESFFSDCRGQVAVGEATPDYLHGQWTTNDVAALIHRHLPGARLIASLRNPIERAYSRYLNAKAKRDYNVALTFEEKLLHRPEFLREGYYYDHLTRYLDFFPREQILILLYDDLLANPREFMFRIYDFLGIDTNVETGIENVTINAAAGKRNLAKSKILWQLSRALGRVGMYRFSEKIRRDNSVAIAPMSVDVYCKLLDFFREKNLNLESLIERDLSHWNQLPARE